MNAKCKLLKYLPFLKNASFSLWSSVGFFYMFFPVSAWANIVGVGAQNFNTIPSGIDFVTVHSSETLEPGIINTGLFLNYAINTLPYFDNTETSRLSFKDALLVSDLNIGMGIFKNFAVGLSLPVLIHQAERDVGYRGEFESPGLTEIRLLTKYRVLGNDKQGVAVIFSTNFNRIENDPMAGSGAGPTLNFEIAADKSFGKYAVGVNFGYRARNPGAPIAGFPMEPLQNQVIASVAASYLLPSSDTKLIAEIFSGFPTSSQADLSNRSNAAAEFIVGAKHDYTESFALHFGMGSELMNAKSSPDWRFYSGINYAFGPVFKASKLRLAEDGSEILVISNIQFKFDSNEMTPDSQAAVEELVKVLGSNRNFKELKIEGHTDSIGPAAYNLDLSQRRSSAIKDYLVKVHGFDAKNISANGFGEEKPIADNGNFQGRQSNRRVEFKIQR